MKRKGIITTIAFILVIAIFALGSLFLPDRAFSENENRALQPFPKITQDGIISGDTQAKINTYASDQLIFRDELITLKTSLQYLSGKRDIGGTYICKGGQYVDKLLESELDPSVFNRNVSAISLFFKNTKNILPNANLYLFPIPTSAIAVKDSLPIGAEVFDQEKRIDTLKKIDGANYIDISKTLKNAEQQVYYKTDPHWNKNGVYLAYNEFCKTAGITPAKQDKHTLESSDFYGTLYSKAPLPFATPDEFWLYNKEDAKNYTVTVDGTVKKGIYDLSYLNKKDKYSVFLGGNKPLVTVSNGKGKGHLLIIRDSFASSMLPYLMENYESVTLLDTRYYFGSVTTLLKDNNYTDIIIMIGLNDLVNNKTLNLSNIIN